MHTCSRRTTFLTVMTGLGCCRSYAASLLRDGTPVPLNDDRISTAHRMAIQDCFNEFRKLVYKAKGLLLRLRRFAPTLLPLFGFQYGAPRRYSGNLFQRDEIHTVVHTCCEFHESVAELLPSQFQHCSQGKSRDLQIRSMKRLLIFRLLERTGRGADRSMIAPFCFFQTMLCQPSYFCFRAPQISPWLIRILETFLCYILCRRKGQWRRPAECQKRFRLWSHQEFFLF